MGPLLIGAAKGCASLVGFGLLFFVGVSRQVEVQMQELEMEAAEALEELADPPEDSPLTAPPAE